MFTTSLQLMNSRRLNENIISKLRTTEG